MPTLRLTSLPSSVCVVAIFAIVSFAVWDASTADDAAPAKAKPAPASEAAASEAAEPVNARPVVTKLDNPSGVAVHPKNGQVFVASHLGVYRYVPKDHKAYVEIAGYPTDVYGKGPKYNVGPLGVAFLDDDHLVVGDGSRPDGDELVRIYKVPRQASEKTQNEGDAVHTLGPIKAGENSAKGEGNFYGVAVGAGKIFVTCNGDDTKGWIASAKTGGEKPGELTTAIATKEATNVDAPVAITFNPEGNELVVGQMGEMNVPGDSLLTFYDPESGKLKKSLKTGLSDIAGLAYSPITKSLYAVDFSWAEPDKAGLFRLTVEGDSVKAEKIIALDKPTALAFNKRGRLYITVFGKGGHHEAETERTGALLAIKPGL